MCGVFKKHMNMSVLYQVSILTQVLYIILFHNLYLYAHRNPYSAWHHSAYYQTNSRVDFTRQSLLYSLQFLTTNFGHGFYHIHSCSYTTITLTARYVKTFGVFLGF